MSESNTLSTRSSGDFVREFHEVFGLPVLDRPAWPGYERQKLRMNLIREEFKELEDSIYEGDLAKFAKELGDLLYVVYGCAHEFGIPLDTVLARIHYSNMSKLGPDGKPIYRADGKVLKGPYYYEPELRDLV